MSLRTRLWFIAFPLLLALTGACTWVAATGTHDSDHVSVAIFGPLIALSFVISGLIAWSLRPGNGTGRLMCRVGVLWMVNALYESDNGWLLGYAGLFGTLFLAAFLHLLLVFPDGRLARTIERRLVIGLYAVAFMAGALPPSSGRASATATPARRTPSTSRTDPASPTRSRSS